MKKGIAGIFVFCFASICFPLFAEDLPEVKAEDILKKESMDFSLSVGINISDGFFEYSRQKNLLDEMEIYESMEQGTGMSLYGSIGYRGYGLSFSHKFNGGGKDDHSFKSSEIFEMDLVYFSDKYAVLSMYKNVKGYGYPEEDGYDEYWDDNLKTRSIGARLMYSFSDDFSLKAVYRCMGKQKGDEGSFYVTGRVFYNDYDNNGKEIFPPLFRDKVSDSADRDISRLSSINFLPTVGYAYNWQWTNFALYIGVDAGVGYQYYWYDVAGGGNGSGHNALIPFYSNSINFDMGWTYNCSNYYMLVSVMDEGLGVRLKEIVLLGADLIVHYEAGVRF